MLISLASFSRKEVEEEEEEEEEESHTHYIDTLYVLLLPSVLGSWKKSHTYHTSITLSPSIAAGVQKWDVKHHLINQEHQMSMHPIIVE